MSNVFHRAPKHAYPVAVRGDGAYLIDAAGKRYLDASGGAAVSCLGHSDRAVTDAIRAQLERLAYVHSSFFTTEPMEALACALARSAPKPLDKVYFTSGGSEATEAALKMARQFFIDKGEPQRTRIIARRQSYHGNTLGALATGGNAFRRKPYEPLLIEATHVSPCYPYREQPAGESDEAYAGRLADELDRAMSAEVMAFVAETVVGATLGSAPAVPGYFRKIKEVCERHGALLILDEVMCGMGRCGTLWAFEQEGVVPDMVTIAKGLGAGYQPIGAVVLGAHIYHTIVGGSGAFQHGTTYHGHAAACAGALAVYQRLTRDELVHGVRAKGQLLEKALRAAFADHLNVGDIRGRGLFWTIELVEDRKTRRAFDPALRLHARVKQEALDAGLLCYPMGGTLDGKRGDHVLLAPPFIVDEAQIAELVEKLEKAVRLALAGVSPR